MRLGRRGVFAQGEDFVRLLIGDAARPLVVADVAFLAKGLELHEERAIAAQGERQRLKGEEMVRLAGDAIAFGGEARQCDLQRGVVGDGQPPIGAQARRTAVVQVSLDNAQQVSDFPRARFMFRQPGVLQPFAQAHVRPRSRRFFRHSGHFAENDALTRF